MSETPSTWKTPYTPTPGSSTPGPEVTPSEGISELMGFFWLSLANTAIIVVVGMAVWFYIH
jgi:hypothetical protein